MLRNKYVDQMLRNKYIYQMLRSKYVDQIFLNAYLDQILSTSISISLSACQEGSYQHAKEIPHYRAGPSLEKIIPERIVNGPP